MILYCGAVGFHAQEGLTMTSNESILDVPGMALKQLQEQNVDEICQGKSLLGKDRLIASL